MIKYTGDAIIKELQNRLAYAETLLNHDGRSSDRMKGGQLGHLKAVLEAPDESEITDTVDHPLQNDECCPKCGLTDCTPTGESEVKFEYDVRIKVYKFLPLPARPKSPTSLHHKTGKPSHMLLLLFALPCFHMP